MRPVTPTARTKGVVYVGQSLAGEQTFADGFSAFAMTMASFVAANPVALAGYARCAYFADPTAGYIPISGAAMLQRYESISGRSWRSLAGTAGPLQTTYTTGIAAWNAVVGPPTFPTIASLYFDQGQTDVGANGGNLTLADGTDYETGMAAMLLAIRTAANPGSPTSVKNVLCLLGKRYDEQTLVMTPQGANANIIRDAQLRVRNALPAGNVRAIESYDLPSRDGTHPNQIGYRNLGVRHAFALMDMLGVAGMQLGPTISTVTRAAKTISITIATESGRTLVKPSSPIGFGFYNGATRVDPVSWSWSGNVLTASFASAPVGYSVRYLDQYLRNWNFSNVIRYAQAPVVTGLDGLVGEPLRSVLPFTVT